MNQVLNINLNQINFFFKLIYLLIECKIIYMKITKTKL